MGVNKTPNKKSRGKLIAIITIIIAIVALCVGVWFATQDDVESPTQSADQLSEQATEPVFPLDYNLAIINITSYEGPFVEDGTNEEVFDVMAITLVNNGTQVIQYAELDLEYNGGMAEFSFSTLSPGEEMVVLEKNCLKMPEELDIVNSTLKNVAFFQEPLSLCEDQIQIQALDGALNIKNITDQDITGRVIVYYKNYSDDFYLGGITYRIVIEEGIEAGGIKQVMTHHFSAEGSKVVFATCEP